MSLYCKINGFGNFCEVLHLLFDIRVFGLVYFRKGLQFLLKLIWIFLSSVINHLYCFLIGLMVFLCMNDTLHLIPEILHFKFVAKHWFICGLTIVTGILKFVILYCNIGGKGTKVSSPQVRY